MIKFKNIQLIAIIRDKYNMPGFDKLPEKELTGIDTIEVRQGYTYFYTNDTCIGYIDNFYQEYEIIGGIVKWLKELSVQILETN